MSTISGFWSAEDEKSAAIQLLRGQSRLSANSVLEMLGKVSALVWKVKAGRDASFTCLGPKVLL